MRRIALLAAVVLVSACVKEPAGSSESAPQQGGSVPASGVSSSSSLARYAGIDYSQSVTITDANKMIGSYLASVHYPDKDSALRSLTFDADTLRRYLADTSIKTLKFFMAHRPEWAMGNTYGRYAGYNPSAMTLVVIGLSQDDKFIPNSRNEVYEHFAPCPWKCETASGATINVTQ